MNAPCSGAPLTASHVTTGGLCRWKAINKEGRHVALDFYDLLIEGDSTSLRRPFAPPPRGCLTVATPSDICKAKSWLPQINTALSRNVEQWPIFAIANSDTMQFFRFAGIFD